MRAKDLINYTIPPLKLSDKVEKAKTWMNEFHVHELPVVENGSFLGIFTESLLFDQIDNVDLIEDFHFVNDKLSIDQDEHYYEVLKNAYEANSNMVAVLDNQGQYLGVIMIQDVIEAFSKMVSITSPGSIIILSMAMIDYSMAEIARIVESEGAKVLSSFIEMDSKDAERIKLTLKLNQENSTLIVSTFQRFGYNVSTIFGKGEEEGFEKERLDTLMRYLQI